MASKWIKPARKSFWSRMLPFSILRRKTYDGLIRKANYIDAATRPDLPFNKFAITSDHVIVPAFPLPWDRIYEFVAYSPTVRTIIHTVTKSVFRFGIDVKENFASKCTKCGEEYKTHDADGICDRSGCGGTLKEPDPSQKAKTEGWMKSVNDNKQSLVDISEIFEFHRNVSDNGYILVLKSYDFNSEGELLGARINETISVDPRVMFLVQDAQGRPGRDSNGDKIYVCINPDCGQSRRNVYTVESRCPACKFPLYNAVAMSKVDQENVYYVEGEVVHDIKYHKDMPYGFSNILTAWVEISTLINQSVYMMDYYARGRSNNQMLFVAGNPESIEKAFQWAETEAEKNPHFVPPIAVPPSAMGNSKKIVEKVDLTYPLAEMQYVEARNELRKVIGALYGVMPLFQGDTGETGGLNNEGLQIKVTNDALEFARSTYNSKIYPALLAQMGITDWHLEVVAPEARDEMSKLTIEQQKINNAMSKKQLLSAKVTEDEDGNFDFEPMEQQTASFDPAAGQTEDPAKPTEPEKPGFGFGSQGHTGLPDETDNPGDEFRKSEGAAGTSTPGARNPTSRVPREDREELIDRVKDEVSKIEKQDFGGARPVRKFSSEEIEKLADLIKGMIFGARFDGIGASKSERIKKLIAEETVKGSSLQEMVERIRKVGISRERSEIIARTESQAVSHAIREFTFSQYDDGMLKYKWIGPDDARTSEICRMISKETAGGVTMAQLRKIIQEKGIGGRDLVPHPNCRHTFVRAF